MIEEYDIVECNYNIRLIAEVVDEIGDCRFKSIN